MFVLEVSCSSTVHGNCPASWISSQSALSLSSVLSANFLVKFRTYRKPASCLYGGNKRGMEPSRLGRIVAMFVWGETTLRAVRNSDRDFYNISITFVTFSLKDRQVWYQPRIPEARLTAVLTCASPRLQLRHNRESPHQRLDLESGYWFPTQRFA